MEVITCTGYKKNISVHHYATQEVSERPFPEIGNRDMLPGIYF